MKVLFTVQGEGRGHLTQALAVWNILKQHQHTLAGVIAGKHGSRSLPSYFEAGLPVPVQTLISPGFSFKNNRGVDVPGTLFSLARHLRDYRSSLAVLETTIARVQPEVIINFLEPLMGCFNLLKRPRTPVITVGHQFMLEHPQFPRTRKFWLQQVGMRRYIRMTAARSARLALSFYAAPDFPGKRLFVCPPLLRPELFQLKPEENGNFLLIYVVNHAYADDVRRWHATHPEVELHCFYDRPGAPTVEQVDSTLTFHALDGKKFLEMMAQSRGVVCTAGVESISEAAWLGKPLLMVPVEKHVEQFLNTLDAGPEHGALGIADTQFNLSRLLDGYPLKPNVAFRDWMGKAESTFLRVMESVTSNAVSHAARPAVAARAA